LLRFHETMVTGTRSNISLTYIVYLFRSAVALTQLQYISKASYRTLLLLIVI